MTSTLRPGAALDRIIAPWMAMIAVFLHMIVKTILTIAPKLEAMGRHALSLRCRTGFLPPVARAPQAAIDPGVRPFAQMREARQATSPQVLLDREEQPEANEYRRARGSRYRNGAMTCPHVK